MTALLPALTSLLAFVFARDAARPVAGAPPGLPGRLVLRDAVLRPRAPARRRSPPPAAGPSRSTASWYLTGAVWTAGWLGLGTAFLLGRTRFGYTYAVLLLLSGLVALMIRNSPTYAGAGPLPLLYLIGAVILALAIGVETYFQNPRWPRFAAGAIVGVTILSLVLMILTPPLPAPGYALSTHDGPAGRRRDAGLPPAADPDHEHPGRPVAAPRRGVLDLRVHAQARVLPYSLDPNQPGDQFLFNLLIAPVAIVVNLVASLPSAFRELVAGRLPLAGARRRSSSRSARSSRRSPTRSTGPARPSCSSWASSWASCSCSRASSSRSRCSARSACRSPRSACRRPAATGPRAATPRCRTPSCPGRRRHGRAGGSCGAGDAGAARHDGAGRERGCRRDAERSRAGRHALARPHHRFPACRGGLCSTGWMGHRRVPRRRRRPPRSGSCSWTTTRSCGGGCKGFFELLDDIEIVGEAEDGAPGGASWSRSTSPTSC